MIKRLNLRPENFFLTRKNDGGEIQARSRNGCSVYTLFGTPIYFEFLAGHRGPDLFGLGDSDRNIRVGKVPANLMTDAHYSATPIAGEGGVGEIWRGGRRGARSALRELHGALRVRTDGEPWFAGEARRYWKTIKFNFGRNRNRQDAAAKLLPLTA